MGQKWVRSFVEERQEKRDANRVFKCFEIRIFRAAKSHSCWVQCWCLMKVVLTAAARLQTILAVGDMLGTVNANRTYCLRVLYKELPARNHKLATGLTQSEMSLLRQVVRLPARRLMLRTVTRTLPLPPHLHFVGWILLFPSPIPSGRSSGYRCNSQRIFLYRINDLFHWIWGSLSGVDEKRYPLGCVLHALSIFSSFIFYATYYTVTEQG